MPCAVMDNVGHATQVGGCRLTLTVTERDDSSLNTDTVRHSAHCRSLPPMSISRISPAVAFKVATHMPVQPATSNRHVPKPLPNPLLACGRDFVGRFLPGLSRFFLQETVPLVERDRVRYWTPASTSATAVARMPRSSPNVNAASRGSPSALSSRSGTSM
eukprot:3916300-Prymnesium_polylepis.1